MRRFTIILAVALAAAVLPAPSSTRGPSAVSYEIPLVFSPASRFVSHEIDTDFTLVGLTWDGPAPTAASFRFRQADGTWSEWEELPIAADHGPDPNTVEHREQRLASEPVWTGPSDRIQFDVQPASGTRDLRAALVDSKPSASRGLHRLINPLGAAPSAAAAVAQPTINPRTEWDADGSCLADDPHPPDEIQVSAAFVHHTAGATSYSEASVPEQILAICRYHVDARGWNDIAYNFLIDRYGNIWEGRMGGIEKGISGAHTGGFNTYSMGVAFMGTHTTLAPTNAAQDALADLLSWKASLHNFDPTGTVTLISKGSTKYEQGTPVTLNVISGHRDASSTTCPGSACYVLLPSFRADVDAAYTPLPADLYSGNVVGDFDGDGEMEAASYRPSDGKWRVADNGTATVWATFSGKTGWKSHVVGDFDGDGLDDIANFHPENNTWWVSRSTGTDFSTKLWATFSSSGWTSQVVGDFDGDGLDDIANFNPKNNTWWVSRSVGYRFQTSLWATFSSSGWTTQLAGDFDGDGLDDIANFNPKNNTWWVSRSVGYRYMTWLWATHEASDYWSAFSVGDFNDDGKDDLASLDAYNGIWDVGESSGALFDFVAYGDGAWRTLIAGTGAGGPGADDILYFNAQEFVWTRAKNDGGHFTFEELARLPR